MSGGLFLINIYWDLQSRKPRDVPLAAELQLPEEMELQAPVFEISAF